MSLNTEGFLHLTPRENEVLQLIMQGMCNKEIANELDVAVVTVKLHVQHLMKKTGTKNRTHLAVTYLNSKERQGDVGSLRQNGALSADKLMMKTIASR